MAIVTLLSDFGSASPYPAEMKAVLAASCDATFVDITHDVPRFDVRAGAYLLRAVVRTTPAGTVHLAVVDPGVGTERRPLIVAAGGQWFVGPDNGLLIPAAQRLGAPHAYEITPRDPPGGAVSTTFHGRDLFAPAAADLARGMPPDALGRPAEQWVDLEFGTGHRDGDALVGRVIYIDPFGNLVTNIPAELLAPGAAARVTVGRRSAYGMTARAYGEARPDAIVAVPGSDDLVEIAAREGSARAHFGAAYGSPVRITTRPTQRVRRRAGR